MSAIIGLTGRRASSASSVRGSAVAAGWQYVRAVSDARGQSVVLPPLALTESQLRELVSRLDGVILHGGMDISPGLYGEDPHPEVESWDEDLDHFEMMILRVAMEYDKPVLAICRGMQLLNVALGGTLLQHLPDHAPSETVHWASAHEIAIKRKSTLFGAIKGERVESVSSYHHQAIGQLGKGLRVVAHAPDGIIEGVEHELCSWIVGVQWHPEDTLESVATTSLFNNFVEQCARMSTSPRH